MNSQNIIWFDQLSVNDVSRVGGKNASLGEMIKNMQRSTIHVPNGFATTADAFRKFLLQNNLQQKINHRLHGLDINDMAALEAVGAEIRQWIIETEFFADFKSDLEVAYAQLLAKRESVSVAVRSSATAEDLPTASFAGQQETYLHINNFTELLEALKKVFASLYTNRAIVYRVNNGFPHEKVALSTGVQIMVRSDLAASGVAFSIDTESGFEDVVFINAAYGLGETVVQGAVNPDEYYLFKPNLKANRLAILSKKMGEKAIKMTYNGTEKTPEKERLTFALSDEELHELGRAIVTIEKHYKRPMDIEWAKDGIDGKIYIVQARPETVKSRHKSQVLKHYQLLQKGKIIVTGRSVGEMIGKGTARVLADSKDLDKFVRGEVLVTDMTDPDWEPIMKKAAAIVTNRGGRTCHAAIVARELGIPAVVGCQDATVKIKNGQAITVSCAEGETGYVYENLLDFECKEINVGKMPKLPVKIMLNLANPDSAFEMSSMPNDGVGLARLEFIINDMIGIHPNALLNFPLLNKDLQEKIAIKISGYKSPIDFYVDKLREGVATIAAAFYPKPIIVRFSDFKTNEYANLLGGEAYEPKEENPMLGFRGASRYVHEAFKDCFALECRALKAVRDDMGLTNVEVMIPFCRTIMEFEKVLAVLKENGLERGKNGLKVIMMCEIPSNVILAEEFLNLSDGFSIGSNDLTQLTLGLDRDSNIVADLFDERNAAVKFLLQRAISTAVKMKKYIGICGQAPSDYPDLAKWLLEQDIESISLNPDSVIKTWLYLAKV